MRRTRQALTSVVSRPKAVNSRALRAAVLGSSVFVWLIFVCAVLVSACGLGESITLGSSPEDEDSVGATGGRGGLLPLEFDGVSLVTALSHPDKDDNPTLTADELLICFTSLRVPTTGDLDVWCAERFARDEDFGEPFEVSEVNTVGFESSAALSLDGLELWIGSDREGGAGGMDIYLSTRPDRSAGWSVPVLDSTLNSEADDIPRPPAMNGTIMPLGSRRDTSLYYTFLAERAAPGQPFSEPEVFADISAPIAGISDAQLSEDGLLLVFAMKMSEENPGDLYAAERRNLSDRFVEAVEIIGVNTEADDRDPWLSPDRRTLYFSSDRSGDFEIYQATLVAR